MGANTSSLNTYMTSPT